MTGSSLADIRSSQAVKAIRPAVRKVQSAWESVTKLPRYMIHFGVNNGYSAYKNIYSKFKEKKEHIQIRIPSLHEEVTLRVGTTDISVFEQVFLKLEYDFELPDSPGFIVDAGAHIGCASLFFANRFPECEILALEPEPSNFRLLQKNVAPYSNITTLQAALWGDNSTIEVANPDQDNWMFRMKEKENKDNGIPAVTVDKAMDYVGKNRLDILKMDIEGGEVEVLQNYRPWIDDVKTIIVELHGEWRMTGSPPIEEIVRVHNFEKKESGENIVLTRKG